jgi:hypothetical protein
MGYGGCEAHSASWNSQGTVVQPKVAMDWNFNTYLRTLRRFRRQDIFDFRHRAFRSA